MEQEPDGTLRGKERRLADLTAREVLLAVVDGRIRPPEAQTSTLARRIAKPTKKRHQTGSTARLAARDGLLIIGRSRVDPTDLAPLLRQLGFRLERTKPVES